MLCLQRSIDIHRASHNSHGKPSKTVAFVIVRKALIISPLLPNSVELELVHTDLSDLEDGYCMDTSC